MYQSQQISIAAEIHEDITATTTRNSSHSSWSNSRRRSPIAFFLMSRIPPTFCLPPRCNPALSSAPVRQASLLVPLSGWAESSSALTYSLQLGLDSTLLAS